MEKVWIAGSSRTPIGVYDGVLKNCKEQELAVYTVKAVLEETGINSSCIDEIIFGIAKQTSTPSNCARYIGLAADIPESVPAYTVQKQGASGMQAIVNGFVKIRSGNANVILAGGAESMSQIPYEIQDARYTFSPDKIVVDPIRAMVAGGQPSSRYGKLTIEDMNGVIADAHSITNDDQIAYAMESLRRAQAAALDEQLIPIIVKEKKITRTITADELYVQASEVAGAADAAAACLLVGEQAAKEKKIPMLGELVSIGISAGSPTGDGMVGIQAAKKALEIAGKTACDVDVIQVNELTAAQSIALIKGLGITAEEAAKKVNPYGGALATGNAWGASGCVEFHRLLCALRMQHREWGLGICGAEGGQAIAVVVRMALLNC